VGCSEGPLTHEYSPGSPLPILCAAFTNFEGTEDALIIGTLSVPYRDTNGYGGAAITTALTGTAYTDASANHLGVMLGLQPQEPQ
jgi:hypothetical protein